MKIFQELCIRKIWRVIPVTGKYFCFISVCCNIYKIKVLPTDRQTDRDRKKERKKERQKKEREKDKEKEKNRER